MEYKIVSASSVSPGDIETAVNALIAEGWRPQGGVCANFGTLYQAMVKETPE